MLSIQTLRGKIPLNPFTGYPMKIPQFSSSIHSANVQDLQNEKSDSHELDIQEQIKEDFKIESGKNKKKRADSGNFIVNQKNETKTSIQLKYKEGITSAGELAQKNNKSENSTNSSVFESGLFVLRDAKSKKLIQCPLGDACISVITSVCEYGHSTELITWLDEIKKNLKPKLCDSYERKKPCDYLGKGKCGFLHTKKDYEDARKEMEQRTSLSTKSSNDEDEFKLVKPKSKNKEKKNNAVQNNCMKGDRCTEFFINLTCSAFHDEADHEFAVNQLKIRAKKILCNYSGQGCPNINECQFLHTKQDFRDAQKVKK